ncbi:MAG: MAPEG family protein [Pseudomonadales bacterium]|nr:MAPEG family protein [Pseudomonadales bacterium]
MEFTALVILASLVQYFLFAFSVAAIREKTGIEPPEVHGDEQLVRAIAAHRNTGEFIPIFIGLIAICAYYLNDIFAAGVGVFWLVTRQVYRHGYMKDVKSRIPGFLMGDVVLAVLLLGRLWGLVNNMIEA